MAIQNHKREQGEGHKNLEMWKSRNQTALFRVTIKNVNDM